MLRRWLANSYVLALVAILVAFAVQTVVGPSFGRVFTFVPFCFAVMLAARIGGAGPALCAMVLGYFLAAYYFVSPGSLIVEGRDHVAGAAIYLLVCLSTTLLAESLHRSRRSAEETREELREADRRKNEFLAMLSHELRNPLATIHYANCIAQLPTAAAKDTNYTRVIDEQVKHLVRLIDDLLDVSRIKQNKIELQTRLVDAPFIIRRAIAASRPLLDARRHQLRVEVADEPMPLQADPTRLQQVVANLLSNAAKYTPEEGGIELSARPEGADFVLTVKDNGVGMPRELIPRVFELFAQGERTLDRSEGGLGIGLTLVRRLVEMHGGTVTASSEGPGRGSEFTVRLPLAGDAAAAEAETHPREFPVAKNPLKILIVEDNIDSSNTMAVLLEHSGHHVAQCHNGTDAHRAANALNPDVVLLDIGLPGLDGYEVARTLRQDATLRDVTIIGLSGYGQQRDRRLSQAAGFDDHLLKPVDFSRLLARLGRIEARGIEKVV